MSTDCPVCIEPYTIRLRKAIHCPHCPFVCCIACMRQFILSSATEPACMACKVPFNYEFLMENLPRTFWHKDYKEFRKDLLLAREEALLPDTQACITRIYRKEQLWKYIEAYRRRLNEMRAFHMRLFERYTRMDELLDMERRGVSEIAPDHPFFLFFNEDNTPMLDDRGEIMGFGHGEDASVVPRQNPAISSTFIHACPNEECRGFLRGEQSRCTICRTEVCPRCLQTVRDDQHECAQEDIETTNLLRQNTRPCPSCSMSIYKISGCDQMWCTQCRTPFSWRTGKKINQTIHNPHYYEWMQQNPRRQDQGPPPRELMDIPCGGLPTIDQLQLFPARYRQWSYGLHRHIHHVEQVSIPHSQRLCEQNENSKDLRIQYLLNKISKDDWRTELYRREKMNQKHLQYIQILQTFVTVSADWMRRMILDLQQWNKDLSDEIRDMIRFFTYINEQVERLNHRFKSSLENLPPVVFRVRV